MRGMFRKNRPETDRLKPAHQAKHYGVRFQCRYSEGFTLLEVMIAVAILAGVIVTVITSLNYHIGVVERNKDITIATLLAREKLEEIRINGIKETQKGDFTPRFDRFSWKYNREDHDFPGIKKVYLTVSWGEGEKVSLETYEISE